MKICVLFVEPMRYGLELIEEVYKKTEHNYKYIYIQDHVVSDNVLSVPKDSIILSGNPSNKKRQLVEELDSFNPEIMIINGYTGKIQVSAIQYCWKKTIPYAVESDTPLRIPNNPIKAIGKRILLKRRLGNKLCYGFAGGTPQKENFLYYGIDETRCFILPMCVSENRFLEQSRNLSTKQEIKESLGFEPKKVFLYVGRLAEEKNVQLLLKAFSKMDKESSILLILGDGPEGDVLKEYVRSNNLDNVFFKGHVFFPEIVSFYKAADCFVLPSKSEPWGLVVNEAMIMGLPLVLSSAVGCCSDLMKESQNGFIFDNNDIEDLEKSLNMVLRANLSKMGETSKQIIANWGMNDYLRNYNDALQVMISNRG